MTTNPPKSRVKQPYDDTLFRSRIVEIIVSERDPERAVYELSQHYRVEKPSLRMGLPKGEKKALGCYVSRERTIYLSSRDSLYDPYVVIHEFYHHLRSTSGKHRGTEKHAKEFALSFLRDANVPAGRDES